VTFSASRTNTSGPELREQKKRAASCLRCQLPL
jgi:hypothetical protein